MKCEKCGGKLKVIDTAEYENNVFRYRKCPNCGEKYYTREGACRRCEVKAILSYKAGRYKGGVAHETKRISEPD